MFSKKVYKHLYKPQKGVKKPGRHFLSGLANTWYLQLNQTFVDHFLSS